MSEDGAKLSLADSDAFVGRKAQMFPQLTIAQIARLEAHGTHSRIAKGQILTDIGERGRPLFVVLSGSIEVVTPHAAIIASDQRRCPTLKSAVPEASDTSVAYSPVSSQRM